MEARLGVYEKEPYKKPGVVDEQATKLETMGGYRQQDRMIRAKRQTLDRALHFSYQAAEISPINNPEIRHRALINPNATKPDYDDKILSIGYENNYKVGDVFTWHGRQGNKTVDSQWIIYLQDLTELAYFKGDIRKCNYYVRWLNENKEELGRWFAIRGPVETKINYLQKEGVSLDTPNYTLNILMTKDDETVKYFKRYSKFYVSGVDEITDQICWRVVATDTMSMPGVIEITALEYYANESEDDDGLVGALVATPESSNDPGCLIQGQDFIKPKLTYTYEYTGTAEGKWVIDTKVPINVVKKGKVIEITWTKTYSGEFTLSFGDSLKKVVVESLF